MHSDRVQQVGSAASTHELGNSILRDCSRALLSWSSDFLVELTTPRFTRQTSTIFVRKASKLGFKGLRFHDLRGTHETLLLDNGVPVHVVAARCGHDPATLLRSYAKRTRKADTSAASVIGSISRGILRG